MAGEGTSQIQRIEMMKAFLDAFNRHDVDDIMDFFTDDCEFDMPRGPAPCGVQLRGKERVREGIASRFAGIPDVHYGDDDHWTAGDVGYRNGQYAAPRRQVSLSR